ncbi:MAG: biotin/lipoyl-containing protein, partial [Candidatus Binataceae bacterium]
MAVEVIMPQMGESVVEGTVTKWLVKVGDSVREDQPLCEISTDKVDTEIPSPGAGVIVRLVAAEGQTLAVGALLAVIDAAGDAAAASGPQAAAPVALIFCFDALLFFLVVPLAMAFVRTPDAGIGRALRQVVRGVLLNPLLIA